MAGSPSALGSHLKFVLRDICSGLTQLGVCSGLWGSGMVVCSVALTDHPGQLSGVFSAFIVAFTIYRRSKTVSLVDLKIFLFVCVHLYVYVCMYMHVYMCVGERMCG